MNLMIIFLLKKNARLLSTKNNAYSVCDRYAAELKRFYNDDSEPTFILYLLFPNITV